MRIQNKNNTVTILAPQIPASFIIALLFICLAFPAALAAADARDADIGNILDAAESVFKNMKKGDYPLLWGGLSAETQRAIVKNSKKSLEKNQINYDDEKIRRDFETGGEIAQGYWQGYLLQFTPSIVLEESRWSMGEVRKDRAEIVIRYRKSKNDAVLKMYREGGVWKVGLGESFSKRGRLW